MIFPGMDPYLENPSVWSGVHTWLIVYLAEQLRPRLAPRYVAAIQERVYIEDPRRNIYPDLCVIELKPTPPAGGVAVLEMDAPVELLVPAIEITEPFLEILDLQTDQRIVTIVEVVSPTNKYAGPGRDLYRQKQEEVRGSRTHLVEIDLLRTGLHVLAIPEHVLAHRQPYDYLVSVNRANGYRDRFQVYPRRLRERLPRIGLPLADGDPDVALDIQAALERAYVEGSFDRRLRYDRPCVPPLTAEDQAWADALIGAARGVAGR